MATTGYGTTATATTTNVYPFPKENNTYLEPNHDHDNNNYHVRAHACTREGHMWHKILDAYEDVMGRPMPRFVQSEAEAFIRSGADPSLLLTVIEYTACAPRPSWAYARTVLYRSMERGMRTSIDFMNGLTSRGRAGDEDVPF